MSFVLSELIIEQTIREGLTDLQNNIDIAMGDLFGNLNSDLLDNKYAEDYDKIKKILLYNQIHVLHAFPMADTELPSFSIHLQSDTEEIAQDVLGDFAEEENIAIEPELIVSSFNFDSYDADSAIAYVPDAVDLSNVYKNRWVVLPDNAEIQILEVSNEVGNKFLKLNTDSESIVLTGAKIVSAVNTRIFRQHEIPSREKIMVGVHSQNSLLTKYLYHILKYVLYKGWERFESKNIQLQTFEGSDFMMNQEMLPVQVFSRFLSMNFVARNSWRHKELVVLDSLGNDVSENSGEVKFTYGPQPADGKYKVRAEVGDATNEAEDDTLGLTEEDN